METAFTSTTSGPPTFEPPIETAWAETSTMAPGGDYTPKPGRCPGCSHKAQGECFVCGGAMGCPSLGLAPCRYCPYGKPIVALLEWAQEPFETPIASWPV